MNSTWPGYFSKQQGLAPLTNRGFISFKNQGFTYENEYWASNLIHIKSNIWLGGKTRTLFRIASGDKNLFWPILTKYPDTSEIKNAWTPIQHVFQKKAPWSRRWPRGNILGGITLKSLSFVSTFCLPQQFVDGLFITIAVIYVNKKMKIIFN